jgi:hypothetical protein
MSSQLILSKVKETSDCFILQKKGQGLCEPAKKKNNLQEKLEKEKEEERKKKKKKIERENVSGHYIENITNRRT